MYNTISDVLLYFINKYPYPDELSKTRITKMVYLADLYKTQVIGEQLTEIKWYFDHYGPYVSDVYDAAKKIIEFLLRTLSLLSGILKQ